MVFSSLAFLFMFLPVFFITYFGALALFANKTGSRAIMVSNLILLAFSLFFYYWGEPGYIVFMLGSIVINYVSGLLIYAVPSASSKKWALTSGLLFNVVLLFVAKYFTFFYAQAKLVWHKLPNSLPMGLTFGSHHWSGDLLKLALPIGISFYTFQSISYLIDVYRGQPVQKNPFNLALYISMFPQLIAGPIVRYDTVARAIQQRTHSWDEAYWGFKRFILGLAKKVIIADNMGKLFNLIHRPDEFVSLNVAPSVVGAWLLIIAYSLQIYFDFSAYSDMAIGLGRMCGFHFLENFNYPYIAQSVSDFWRRWHMSLSSWFKDYLYIPLGGNRVALPRWVFNMAVVWGVTGFWHGAAWNFLLWGLYYFVLLVAERLFLSKILAVIPRILRHIYTIMTFLVGWMIFALPAKEIKTQIKGMIGWKDIPFYATHFKTLILEQIPWFIIPIAIILCTPLFPWLAKRKIVHTLHRFGVTDVLYVSLFILTICLMTISNFSPFLYFRF